MHTSWHSYVMVLRTLGLGVTYLVRTSSQLMHESRKLHLDAALGVLRYISWVCQDKDFCFLPRTTLLSKHTVIQVGQFAILQDD